MKTTLLLSLLMLPCILMAQPRQGKALIDSLLQVITTAEEDTGKVNLLNGLSYGYSTVDPGEGIKYGRQALQLATTLNWRKGIAWSNNSLGANSYRKSDYPAALEYFQKALAINEELGDKGGVATLTGNIGNVYVHLGNSANTLKYYFKALNMYERLSDKKQMARMQGNIGLAYMNAGEYREALVYNFAALKTSEELGSKYGMANIEGNIGSVYSLQHNYPKALEHLSRALAISEQLGDKNLIASGLGNIGECYVDLAKDTTMPRSYQALSRKESLGKAVDYLTQAIKMCRETGFLGPLQEFSHSLSEAFELSGNYKDGLESYKQFVSIKDSIFSKDNKVKITNLETKRELELKDKQIEIDKLAVAKKRNERGFFIGGIAVMLVIIVIVYRNYQAQKNTNRLLSIEKQKSEDLLLNILPTEVAEELKQNGTAEAKQYDNVTVIFTDFVNFTHAAEQMTPQQLVGELHTCFKAFDHIVSRYNIEKIKTVGDAYLAVSGLPAGNTNHAANIVSAAIEIRDFMVQRQASLGDHTFSIRIGIHTGSVVAGIVGVKKFAYDIWGDTVNMAARMEQHSEPDKINISQTTYEIVKGLYHCVHRGKIQAKNKGEIDMYFVEKA